MSVTECMNLKRFSIAVWQLLTAWWGADRIRISPAAGRLLSLCVGDMVQICDSIYHIVARRISQGTRHRSIVYSLAPPGLSGAACNDNTHRLCVDLTLTISQSLSN